MCFSLVQRHIEAACGRSQKHVGLCKTVECLFSTESLTMFTSRKPSFFPSIWKPCGRLRSSGTPVFALMWPTSFPLSSQFPKCAVLKRKIIYASLAGGLFDESNVFLRPKNCVRVEFLTFFLLQPQTHLIEFAFLFSVSINTAGNARPLWWVLLFGSIEGIFSRISKLLKYLIAAAKKPF